MQAMKVYGRSRGTAPLILNLGREWRWLVNSIPHPLYYWGKNTRLCGPQSHSNIGILWIRREKYDTMD